MANLMRSRTSHLVAAFAAGAITCATVLAFVPNPRYPDAALASNTTRTAPARPATLAGQSRLDVLRDQAASGDDISNHELTIALLNRYDLTSDSDDLYEAMVWLDRRWDASGRAELAPRVFAQYCGQRVLRWHWLCVMGE